MADVREARNKKTEVGIYSGLEVTPAGACYPFSCYTPALYDKCLIMVGEITM